MSISSEITRISDNVSGALDAIESKGVTIPTGANSDDLPSLISSIKTGSSVVVTPTLLTGTDIASISVDGSSTTLYAPTPPTPSSATPQALGTASPGSSTDYSRADHVHAKPSYSKSDVGLSNVDNVKQYSASNPPPYPVTSVNGSTGAVTVSVPSASSTAPANLAATAAVGTGTTWARADHVHKMPSASDVGALPSSTVIPSAATATPANLGTAAVGTSSKYAKEDHVHNYPDVVHVGSSAPSDSNIELWLDNSSGGGSIVTSVNGSTGAVAITASGLGISDYITERGTSGDWTYVKYASGKCEAWTAFNAGSVASSGQVNGWYWTTYAKTLPAFFTGVEYASAGAVWGTGIAWANARDVSASSVTAVVFGNQNGGNLVVRMHAKGRYAV